MVRQTTSIKMNPELWQEVRIFCIKKKTDISDWLEELIRKELKKKDGKYKTS